MSYFSLGFQSPHRRPIIFPSPTSPFSTSPSQLQEVTLDQDGTFTNGMDTRSPTGNGPMRGRSVKEFEEQLTNLKKENFNLKLRIYFLEERMGTNFNIDKENVVKKNVELMVELESLKKELKEKHELLCQAVKAIELEDEEHKKMLTERDRQIDEYQRQIEIMSLNAKDLREGDDRSYGEAGNTELSEELQHKINALELELQQTKDNATAVQFVLDQKDAKIKVLIAELEEKTAKLARKDNEIEELNLKVEELTNKNHIFTKKLHENKQLVEETMSQNGELLKKQAVMEAEIEREQKRYDRLKTLSDQRVLELQTKLEASTRELRKSQDLVVSKQEAKHMKSTDDDSFSVSKSTTPRRSPKKNSIFVSKLDNSTSPQQQQSKLNKKTTTPPTSPTSSSTSAPSCRESVNGGDGDQNVEVLGLRHELEDYNKKIVKLKAEQLKACKIIKGMIDSRNKANEEIKELKAKVSNLEHELELVVSRPDYGSRVSEKINLQQDLPLQDFKMLNKECSMEGPDDELIENYKTLVNQLETKVQILTATLTEKDNQMKRVQDQYEEILKNLKRQEEHIVDLEFELLSVNQEKAQDNKIDDDIQNYKKIIKEKDQEIELLNDKLKKRNHDLQGIVNHELWEKNREIEKLQKRETFKLIQQKDDEIHRLQNDLKSKNQQLDVIKLRISELGFDFDMDKGVKNKWADELEKSEQLRREANEVCAVLSQRLEELAYFLDSLLRKKSILGFLGNKENKHIREIIDQSLDLTKSFNISALNPDQSLAQLSNISHVLNCTENGEKSFNFDGGSLTYKSHIYKSLSPTKDKNEIIDTLRQEIVNLKYELQLRDVELGKLNQQHQQQEPLEWNEKTDGKFGKSIINISTVQCQGDFNQSESEAWSEPDRSVSRARIGLSDDIKSPISLKKVSTDSDECDKSTTPRSFRKSENNKQTILDLSNQLTDVNNQLTEEKMKNEKLKQELNNLEEKLIDTENQFKDAESRRDVAEKQMIVLQEKIEQLEKEQSELKELSSNKDKEYHNKINRLECEKNDALAIAKKAEESAETAKIDLAESEIKLQNIQMQLEEINKKHEDNFNKQLEIVQTEFDIALKQYQDQINLLQKSIEEMEQNCTTNCTARKNFEEVSNELKCTSQMLKDAQQEIRRLTDQIQEKEIIIKENQNRINNLRSELDNTTLQYSESVLEKTKLANEKTNLEQELSRLITHQHDSLQNIQMLEQELLNSRENHHKNASNLQLKCSKLEMKISELETTNAELHNKLVKIQNNSNQNIPVIVNYQRQLSDQSDYEEQLMADNPVRFGGNAPHAVDNERHEANSSPDLGIESDQGRFSSLETHVNHISRPLLQTLELTESMSNLLDIENNSVKTTTAICNCGSERCCKKTAQVLHENTDLKRELARTRRILQDTVNELALANQRKKQVEKTICRQIHKTSQVLRKAKANLDSGSETDAYHK